MSVCINPLNYILSRGGPRMLFSSGWRFKGPCEQIFILPAGRKQPEAYRKLRRKQSLNSLFFPAWRKQAEAGRKLRRKHFG